MWVVRDEDTVIYLFGTFHLLDGKTDWFNDEVRQAFDSSQELVFEINMPKNQGEIKYLYARRSARAGRTPIADSERSVKQIPVFSFETSERRLQQLASRYDHDVDTCPRLAQPEHLANQTFGAVSFDGSADLATCRNA